MAGQHAGLTPLAHAALSPCVAVHTEETQLPRFADRLRGFQLPPACVVAPHSVAVVAVASPLIYVQLHLQPATTTGSSSEQSPDAYQLNAELRAYAEQQLSGGRIRAHRVYQLDWSCADPEWIPSAAPVLHLKQQHAVIRVVAFPKQLQSNMTALLQSHGLQTHPTHFSHELYVVMQPLVSPYFHFGVTASSQNSSNSSASTNAFLENQLTIRAPSFAADAPCRAYFKMDESLRHHVTLKPGDRVLDVGASPGGWTECLLHHGAHVVAVDPGELTIDLQDKPVVHLQMLLEDARPQLESMGRTFAMCVCDINVRVQHMTALMESIAHLLLPGASVVFTLKLGKKPTAQVIHQSFELACAALEPSFRAFQLLWLHANTQNERTLVAVRR